MKAGQLRHHGREKKEIAPSRDEHWEEVVDEKEQVESKMVSIVFLNILLFEIIDCRISFILASSHQFNPFLYCPLFS